MSETLRHPDDDAILTATAADLQTDPALHAMFTSFERAVMDGGSPYVADAMELDQEDLSLEHEVVETWASDVETLEKHRDEYVGTAYCEASVNDDIRTITAAFHERCLSPDYRDETGELDLRATSRICDEIDESIVPSLTNLAYGDLVIIRAPAIITSMAEEAASLSDDMMLCGKFTSVSIGDDPDAASLVTGGEAGGQEMAISLEITDAVIVDPLDDSVSGEHGPVVRVSLAVIPRVHKIVR